MKFSSQPLVAIHIAMSLERPPIQAKTC